MEALYMQPMKEDGVMMLDEEQEKSREQEERGTEAPSPTGSTTEEETDEDSEPEPPPVVRRKVSFADAFGLNLVSVKEFDNVEPEVNQPPEKEATHPSEEFYMSCLFTVPSTPEELDQRLQVQMVELESIELLPGTTTLRGVIRVVNLCYAKFVFARLTLDNWTSSFDLVAEYVPGSSDRKTDRFTFKYTLVPPFGREGIRVEFCLCYETPLGTFWANNKEMNYVLFCNQKGQVKDFGPQMQEDSTNYKSKRSCLRANRRGSTEEKTKETINAATAAADADIVIKTEEADRKAVDSSEIQSLLSREEHNPSVDSLKSRHRGTHLAHVQDYQVPKAYSPDSASGQKVSQPMPAPWSDSASVLSEHQKKQSNESPQVLTYHQIPLLTLHWNDEKPPQWGTADMDDIWTGRDKMFLSKASEENIEDTPPVKDMWETFLNCTDDTTNKGTPVSDVWQAFLNGTSCKDHSAVPESEWLQTEASVSPSNDKEPQTQYAARSQEFQEFENLHAHTSSASQLLSETSLANVALSTEDHQSAEACVSNPRDDNTVTQDASQRSQTNSATDTPQEFSLKGTTTVSEGSGSVDSSTECHKHVIWKRERGGIIGGAEGIGGDEPFTLHTTDLVKSSGESGTTDMTAMPETQNASAVDSISQGARLDKGLSSSREEQVTGTAHNAMDDTLAFRETIRQGTMDGGFVFSTSRQGAEERIRMNCTENEVATEEEIFRPQKTEACAVSQTYTDEKQSEFKLSENPLWESEGDENNEIRPALSHSDEFNPNQTCEENFRQSQLMENKFKLDESQNKDMASNDQERFEQTEEGTFYCTTGEETKDLIGDVEEEWLRNKALQPNSSVLQGGNTSLTSEIHNPKLDPVQAGDELCIQKEEEDSTLTQLEENVLRSETSKHVLVSNQNEESQRLSCGEIIWEQQEINPSSQARGSRKISHSDHDTFRPFPTNVCNPNTAEVDELRRTHSQDALKKDVGSEITQVMVKEGVTKRDTSTEPHHQPEILERIEEDMSQRGKDERVSTGELKIEVMGELMGNVDDTRGKRKNAPAEVNEQELSAEVKRPPRVECNKLSEGTKDPITVAHEVTESGIDKMIIERFGEDLVRRIWEEVFGQKGQASKKDPSIFDGKGGRLADIPDIRCDCHLFEKYITDAFDSGVFSLTELPTDPHLGLGPTTETSGDEYSPQEQSQSLTATEQSHSLTHLNLSAHLSQDLTVSLAAQSRQSLTKSAQTLSSPKDQENSSQIKERSVTHQETDRQTEDCAVAEKESFNRSTQPSRKHPSSSSEKLKESDSLSWWSIFYILSHVTRLLMCFLLVAGFFVVVYFYDFPAFFALYISSLCWWFYEWKTHRVTSNKETIR
ncbi:uncharacterized protein ppp1r3aa [Mastacembelus armatus]|nr:uncharacterized protein LOC113142378 [Mastacembelus armatus]